uniref:Nucleoside-diphosphate kinase n=1 Tax=Lotharella oceanica TaxID=641309 RepID=A0A7S2TMS2_9EUKA|mmetsp:Transcript_21434/g.40155  ORF Transcript_21434/g.40155 Transcript_21434/m.40155 type:complete len:386 (+) Transcript_21434:61-1218(+)
MFARTFRIGGQFLKKAVESRAGRTSMGVIAGGVGLAMVAQYAEVAKADEKPVFVINGFYMSMREKYTKPGKSIYFMTVEWPSASLSWEDFRAKVLGGTDPSAAAAGSVRNDIYLNWESLKLPGKPNVGDNGVHASASPFEGMCERLNWLGADLESDYFGAALLKAGIPKQTVLDWTIDPQVPFKGSKGSIFDFLEDMDAQPCLKKALDISGVSYNSWNIPSVDKNMAFVFIKPHAVTEETKALVKSKFGSSGITITKEGSLDAKTIDEKKLIDQHYYSIANKATLQKPKDLNPPAAKQEKFAEMFGITWEKALEDGLVYNAADACEKLGVDGTEMEKIFGAAKKAGNSIKFGGGFYCAKVEPPKPESSGGVAAWFSNLAGLFGGK